MCCLIVTLWLTQSKCLLAQEHLFPYTFKTPTNWDRSTLNQAKLTKSLTLPFFDDFSSYSPYPSKSNWIDSNATINLTCPLDPASFGVATLDGLSGGGQPHSYIAYAVGVADTLTSRPINLQGNTPADSIYLSFLYEPQGLCDYPNFGDSLLLDFRDTSGQWINVWGVDGPNVQANYSFSTVLMPVTDIRYLIDSFQFRFRNIATLSGLNDHWHIDYVKMDMNRNYQDNLVSDVAFQYLPTNILSPYNSMPYNQFLANSSGEMAPTHGVIAKNNWNVSRNVNFTALGRDFVSGAPFFNPTSFSINMNPGGTYNNTYSAPVSIPGTLTAGADGKYRVEMRYALDPGFAGEFHGNDTVKRMTEFADYLAYDDGSAEDGYGISGNLSYLAQAYHLNTADKLQGVRIHFAHLNADVRNKLFNLMAWSSIDKSNIGAQDQVLATKTLLKPIYVDAIVDSLNGWATYLFDDPIDLPADTFYIGMQQLQADVLNLGFDVNNDSHTQLYYNNGQQWYQSVFAGSVMMRPILGTNRPAPTGLSQLADNSSHIEDLKIIPNPAEDYLILMTKLSEIKKLNIFNSMGQQMVFQKSTTPTGTRINTSLFPSGLFLIQAIDSAGRSYTAQFVKQ